LVASAIVPEDHIFVYCLRLASDPKITQDHVEDVSDVGG
jgi:hypothetical protein